MPRGLTLAQVASLLQTTVPILAVEVTALPETITRFQPAAGEWSINEVIGHLIETEERGFAGRIARIVAEDRYVCQAWDPDQVARDRRDNERTTATLLADFATRRAASLALLHTLTPTDLTRTAEHPAVGPLAVNDLLHEWVFHDRNHIKQILSNVQAYVWPAMGNAQRFTIG